MSEVLDRHHQQTAGIGWHHDDLERRQVRHREPAPNPEVQQQPAAGIDRQAATIT